MKKVHPLGCITEHPKTCCLRVTASKAGWIIAHACTQYLRSTAPRANTIIISSLPFSCFSSIFSSFSFSCPCPCPSPLPLLRLHIRFLLPIFISFSFPFLSRSQDIGLVRTIELLCFCLLSRSWEGQHQPSFSSGATSKARHQTRYALTSD